MKERKNTLLKKRQGPRKGNRLMIALLSVCLIMTSLPNLYYQTFVLAAEMPAGDGQYEILSINEFSEDIKSQTVDIGTPLEALLLPNSLAVSCRQSMAENQETQNKTQDAVTESAPSEDIELESEKSENAASEEAAMESEKSENAASEEAALESGASEEAAVESEASEEAAVEEDTEKTEGVSEVMLEGITWESRPEYDMEQEGIYRFTPVLPHGYRLSEGVVLPEIMVTVKREGDTIEENCMEKVDSDEEGEIFYAEDADVLYAGDADVLYAEDTDILLAEGDTQLIKIAAGQSETWDERTLRDVTVIVEERAVLTITGFVAISGNVTITGGGTIERRGNAACFNVQAGANLTLGNVTMDGGSMPSAVSMIEVFSGKLTLDDGCVIQNCTKLENNGGAIFLDRANAVLNGAAIKNCTASSVYGQECYGGAIYIYASAVDIHGTRFENCSVGQAASNDKGGALYMYNGCKVDINGAVFQSCSAKGSGERSAGGAFYVDSDNTVDIRNTVIEDCSAGTQGGAFLSFNNNVVNIYSGIFRNNRTTATTDVHGNVGGGCMYNCMGTLNIYGGSFLNNYAANKGGCLNHCWEPGTITNITGGIFAGNYCDYKDAVSDYSGSGGIFNSSVMAGQAELKVSGNAKFSGDGTEGSGVDGIYLDQDSGTPRKIFISTTLTFPVNLYVKAVEGYVIAEGKDGYSFLHERDMKKIKFIDISNSGKTWYAKLSDDRTQVTLTETDPGYKYFVYYISNGATGNVVDDNQYSEEDEATVKSHKDAQGKDILTYEGRTFLGWSKNEDGSGRLYQAGDSLGKMTEDINLYAVFSENPVADFYSGSAGNKVTKESVMDADGKGKVKAPQLEDLNDPEHSEDMAGWTKAGWAEKEGQFDVLYQPEDEITLEDNREYCGIYKKDVTLTYDNNGWNIAPAPANDVKPRYGRVHENITYQPAEFTIAPDVTSGDFVFAGWNTEPDGSGEYYHEGDKITSETDLTLYAIFTNSFLADFYSGGAGQKETRQANAGQTWTQPIEAPELKDMDGWDKIGWTEDENQFRADFEAGEELILTRHSSYYGIYGKEVILSYDMNGGMGKQEPVAKSCYANVHSEVSYQPAAFHVAKEAIRDGYVFAGWNTEADGTGETYQEGEEITILEDQTLYARWDIAGAVYRIEHYKQELDGSYRLDATVEAKAAIGDEVSAEAKAYTGFSENTAHEMRVGAGIVAEDGGLVLKLYYDRDIYEVDFDLNGAEGETPERQSVPYGGYVTEVDEPARRGYYFKGWYMDERGLEEKRWDFDLQVEKNFGKAVTDASAPRKVTLYAKWEDETAPVLEDIGFNEGYVNILDWIIRKKSLVVTVPVFEEGSGVKQLDYDVSAVMGDNPKKTQADGSLLLQSDEEPGAKVSKQSHERTAGAGTEGAAGTIEIPESRKRLFYGVLTPGQGEFAAGNIQLFQKGERTYAKITISEDFKGSISLACMDNAGNISSEKTITPLKGGIVVEDNAPEIVFSSKDGKPSQTFSHAVDVNVRVLDHVDENGEERITGGIASVTYQLDKGKEISAPAQAFEEKIVDVYEFAVEVSGTGRHVLRVTAVDNAGNKNTRRTEVNIKKNIVKTPMKTPNENPPQAPKAPSGSEPQTGDPMNVQVYATLAMVAGFLYLLLYFASDNPGITEKEKEELVSRMLGWAKRGGIVRKLSVFAALFFFLLYYHSIGKSENREWNLDDVWQ